MPSQIDNFLITGETIEKTFELDNCEVYATNVRLIKVAGKHIQDFSYDHISSIEYISQGFRHWIIIGIVLIVADALVFYYLEDNLTFIPLPVWIAIAAIGLILALFGALRKLEWVGVYVIGIKNPVHFRGDSEKLSSLLSMIRGRGAPADDVDSATPVTNCPQCGASVENSAAKYCRICGTNLL
jgi:hypothetical protein